jgi:hypothetical protein
MPYDLLGELCIARIQACTKETLRDGIWLSFAYTPDTKVYQAGYDVLMALPKRSRHWNPQQKAWWLSEEGLRQLATQVSCVRHALVGWDESFAAASTERAKKQAEHMRFTLPTTSAEAFAALGLHVGDPLPQVLRARRRLARSEHPDVGGHTQAMKRLNVAVDLCERWWQGRKVHAP